MGIEKDWNIVLFASGNSKIGMGHISRTATLAYTLTKQVKNCPSVKIIWECSDELLSNFNVGDAEVVVTRKFTESQHQLKNLAKKKEHSILAVDLFQPLHQYEFSLDSFGYDKVAYLNDTSWDGGKRDLFVDSDGFKSKVNTNCPYYDVVLAGPRYQIIRPEVYSCRPKQPWQKEKISKMLVSFGGSDPAGMTLKFISAWKNAPSSKTIKTTVVEGPYFGCEHREGLNFMFNKIDNQHFNKVYAPANLPQLIVENDLLISLGGITAYEAMCLGRPVVALAWSHMTKYVEALDKANLLCSLGSTKCTSNFDVTIDRLEKVMGNINYLKECANLAFKKVDGLGAERISRAIIQLLK